MIDDRDTDEISIGSDSDLDLARDRHPKKKAKKVKSVAKISKKKKKKVHHKKKGESDEDVSDASENFSSGESDQQSEDENGSGLKEHLMKKPGKKQNSSKVEKELLDLKWDPRFTSDNCFTTNRKMVI